MLLMNLLTLMADGSWATWAGLMNVAEEDMKRGKTSSVAEYLIRLCSATIFTLLQCLQGWSILCYSSTCTNPWTASHLISVATSLNWGFSELKHIIVRWEEGAGGDQASREHCSGLCFRLKVLLLQHSALQSQQITDLGCILRFWICCGEPLCTYTRREGWCHYWYS